jgi:TusA-related sulfurtransferase
MKKLLFFLSLFLLIGCAEHKVHVSSKPKPIPNWYLNPPQGNKNIVYVSGSGINKKQAVLNALSNFISRYSVTISSNFESKVKSFGSGLYNKHSVKEIKATVKQFEVSNYKVVKAEQYSFDKFFVLIKVDINKLYENVKNKLDNRFVDYKNQFNSIIKENLLKQFIELNKLYSKLKQKEDYIFILKIMNKNFNEKKYLAFINKVKNRLYTVKNNLYIQVISNNKSISEDIKKYLTDKGIKLGKSDIKIKINVNKKISTNYIQLTTYNIHINVEYKNEIIGSNYFKIVVPPNTNINGYLFNQIKNQSLEKFLNLK